MSDSYYKGYWMVTNRCNLRCSYCVLENAPHQLKAELDLDSKKELISHLYHKLNFRRITLSGGEVIIFGKHPPYDFIELLRHIRSLRSKDPVKNLEIEIYTNGTYLDEKVASEMQGVVDMVAVTIDSIDDNFLTELGRNRGRYQKYYERIVKSCNLLSKYGIKLKLHSVICTKNHLSLPDQVTTIIDTLEEGGSEILCWKFYQYMSYDAPHLDSIHSIPIELYSIFKERIKEALHDQNFKLHFKDNKEMNNSLFNILSYGNAQYMRANDTWSTTQRTDDLRTYNSMSELFARHDIDQALFRNFHELHR
jgi:MoaA/NifB/PqqE/SkfB family radical SAM enzyme